MTERETGRDSNKKIRKEVNYNNRRWLIKFEEAKDEMGEIRGKISNQKRLKETFAEQYDLHKLCKIAQDESN